MIKDHFACLIQIVNNLKKSNKRIGLASLPGDIIHSGHIKYLKSASQYCDYLFVLVNNDAFLLKKKGFIALPLEERLEIINELPGVYCVCPWEYYDVSMAIRKLRPDIFFNGGDRDLDNLDKNEVLACQMVDCIIAVGVGGFEKTMSSSEIARDIYKSYKRMLKSQSKGDKN